MEVLIDGYLERSRKLLKLRQGTTFAEAKSNVLTNYLSIQHYVQDTLQDIRANNRIIPRELRHLLVASSKVPFAMIRLPWFAFDTAILVTNICP